jgi:hypothetical protein
MVKNTFLTIICLFTTMGAFAYSGKNGTAETASIISSKANMEQLAANKSMMAVSMKLQ